MSIPIAQARAIFTNAYMEKYKEIVPKSSFLQSFFTPKVYTTKSVSIEVQRGTERIAPDVLRGASGTRVSFSNSTEKQFVPPLYNPYFDATQLDRYDVLFGQNPTLVPQTIGYLAEDVAEKLVSLTNMIDRAKEKQCAQVLETGVVTLVNGDNIDFKRKAASLVDLNAGSGGGYWSITTTDVETQLIKAAEFIRQKGKNGVPSYNLTLSGAAWVLLKKTDFFKNTANYNQVKLLDINLPQASVGGSSYHGQISAGAYIFNVWTYDEVYESDGSGTIARYTDESKAIVTPTAGSRFNLAYAGVPAIITDISKAEFSQYITQQAGEVWFNNYIDPMKKAHFFEALSAPLAIPVTVDMIYTMKVKA